MIHLDIKTGYSFLKAYGSIEQIINRAKLISSDAIGVADTNSTWSHIPLSIQAKKANLKYILGVQLHVVGNLEKDTRYDNVTLLAHNAAGLKSQYDALGLATSQFYYRPRLTWEQLAGVVDNSIIINTLTPESEARIKRFSGGPLYLGARPVASYAMGQCVSNSLKLPVVASIGAMYPSPSDLEAYKLVKSIGSARKVAEIESDDFWMMREGELISKFVEMGISKSSVLSWIDKADYVASQCQAAIPFGQNVKPLLNKTIEEWCLEGAKQRHINLDAEPYKSRYERELNMIHEKGFTDYFLLIADLVNWAKERMFVGPARGSSAGSLVCYLMGIVEVNPLNFGLLFERFIDVNRKDLPDIDIDFPDDRRDEVFEYVIQKYGHDRVARIGTISVFKPKSAINDTAKSYNVPAWEIKKLTEVMIERSGGDARSNMCIADTIEQFDVGKELVKKFPKIKMASTIEGHPRHTGVHAAGIMVSNDSVSNYCAMNMRENPPIAMIKKDEAESIGLLKIDALGLTCLSVLQDCCDQIGMDPKELYTLPLDLPEAFIPFQKDQVAGIFQFEGPAVRSLMRQMGVENFNDIAALTSLARPGPLHCGAANQFINRRTGKEDWEYGIDELKPHVSHTFGTIVYQEQVMSITRDLGSMDWQDVSALRKAMSKSLGEEFFNTFKVKFLKGTDAKNIDRVAAETLWNNMCTFGSWAFNLSHAVSYALLSYWCAYLKAKHPLQFAVAHLRRTNDEDGVLRLLRELIKEGYEFIPFDPVISQAGWSIHKGKIYGGFTSVKGIGDKTAKTYIDMRQANPDTWINNLSPAKRKLILAPNNTPWHSINRLNTEYAGLYTDPDNYISDVLPKGVRGPVLKLEDIKEIKGEYCFIGILKSRNLRDLNETQSVAKRGGRLEKRNTLFLNLLFEDDTSSILATINRWKYPLIGAPLMEQAADGHVFIVRGNILEDGRRKIYINSIRRLSNDSGTKGN